jgi:hypothetical protein
MLLPLLIPHMLLMHSMWLSPSFARRKTAPLDVGSLSFIWDFKQAAGLSSIYEMELST